jgi:predicted glycoside hydrolase/deacetylase ChbG (UPF0249 family)
MIPQKFKKILLKLFSKNIPKRLGYSRKTKLLIIHADDVGLCHDENLASFDAFENGIVNSGSIMVPCEGFNEVVEYAKKNPNADLGIHLTLTSEWEKFKWKPLLPMSEIKGIVNEFGYFPPNKSDLLENYNIDDIKKEFRAQINHAINSGIDITHIDSHMFTAFADQNIIKAYTEIGKEFNLPVLLAFNKTIPKSTTINDLILNNMFIADPEHFAQGLSKYYSQVLTKLKPGLNCLLVHLCYDTDEMQNHTNNEKNFGSAWRQADFDFFTSNECKKILTQNNIRLITWREIRDKLFR